MSTETPQRYSPLLISLHWAIAVLLLTEFILGFATRYIPSSIWPRVIGWHMPLGGLILVLMIGRIIVYRRTPHPKPATTGNPLLDKIGVLTHYMLYLFAILTPLAGMALAGSYNLLPAKFTSLAIIFAFLAPLHKLIAPALALLITLHISAAFYHQLIRKDNLLSRMWYEKKSG